MDLATASLSSDVITIQLIKYASQIVQIIPISLGPGLINAIFFVN